MNKVVYLYVWHVWYIHACACAPCLCAESREEYRVFHTLLYLLRQGLTEPAAHPFFSFPAKLAGQQDPVCDPPVFAPSHAPALRLQFCVAAPGLFCGDWGPKLSSSCLYNRYSIH